MSDTMTSALDITVTLHQRSIEASYLYTSTSEMQWGVILLIK